MAQIYLSIGSNIEPELHFKRCASKLKDQFKNPVWSPVYRSAAVGMIGHDFLNAVVSAQTELSVDQLKNTVATIESDLGRVRTSNKFSSRTMDIDLLLYDDLIIDDLIIDDLIMDDLIIDEQSINRTETVLPRAEILSAPHVLVPLTDLIPNAVHPVADKSYQRLLADLENKNPEFMSTLSVVPISLD